MDSEHYTVESLNPRAQAVGDCWTRDGAHIPSGYAVANNSNGSTLLHRQMYEALVGPIPDGLELDHLCRNRRCFNPVHLEAVTHRENVLRGATRGGALWEPPTHCINGHPLGGDNLYVWYGKNSHLRGMRRCRACNREATRRKRAKQRSA